MTADKRDARNSESGSGRAAALLDRLVATFAPRTALERARARVALDVLHRNFEGAATGRRFAGWRPPSVDANAATRGKLGRLRDRCRDLVRNGAWPSRGRRGFARNVVGSGLVARWYADRPDDPRLKKVRALWKAWAESTACDADGRRDFYGIQRLAMRSQVDGGELLVRLRTRRSSDGLPLRLQLQALEGDYLDDTRDSGTFNGTNGTTERDVQGVRFDGIGRRVGYHLFKEHPGNGVRLSLDSGLVPARDVLHVFEADRAGQVRGVPMLAPAILLARDFDEFEDAELLKAKIAACFVGVVWRPPNDADAFPGSKVGTGATGDRARPLESLEPGAVEYLQEGEDVKFSTPPRIDGQEDFAARKLRAMAGVLRVTYEQLTGDYSKVNFTSGRMGWLDVAAEAEDFRWEVLEPLLLTPVVDRFLEIAELEHGINPEGLRVLWSEPRRAMIDPGREAVATLKEIRTGVRSLSDAIRSTGRDPDEVLLELSEERRKLRDLGIVLESDPGLDSTRIGSGTPGNAGSDNADAGN